MATGRCFALNIFCLLLIAAFHVPSVVPAPSATAELGEKLDKEINLTKDVLKNVDLFMAEQSEFQKYQKEILPLLEKAQAEYIKQRSAEKVQKHQLWNIIGDEFYGNVQSAVQVIRDGPEAEELPEQFMQYEPKFVFDAEQVGQVNQFLEKRDKKAENDQKHFGQVLNDAAGVMAKLNANPELFDDAAIENNKEEIRKQIKKLKGDLGTLADISKRRKVFQNAVENANNQLTDANNVRKLEGRAEGVALIGMEKQRELDGIKFLVGEKNLLLIKLVGRLLNHFTGESFMLEKEIIASRDKIRVEREAIELVIQELEESEEKYNEAAKKVPSSDNVLVKFVSNLFGGGSSKLLQLEKSVKERVIKLYKLFDEAAQNLLGVPNDEEEAQALKAEVRKLVAEYKAALIDTNVKTPKNE